MHAHALAPQPPGPLYIHLAGEIKSCASLSEIKCLILELAAAIRDASDRLLRARVNFGAALIQISTHPHYRKNSHGWNHLLKLVRTDTKVSRKTVDKCMAMAAAYAPKGQFDEKLFAAAVAAFNVSNPTGMRLRPGPGGKYSLRAAEIACGARSAPKAPKANTAPASTESVAQLQGELTRRPLPRPPSDAPPAAVRLSVPLERKPPEPVPLSPPLEELQQASPPSRVAVTVAAPPASRQLTFDPLYAEHAAKLCDMAERLLQDAGKPRDHIVHVAERFVEMAKTRTSEVER